MDLGPQLERRGNIVDRVLGIDFDFEVSAGTSDIVRRVQGEVWVQEEVGVQGEEVEVHVEEVQGGEVEQVEDSVFERPRSRAGTKHFLHKTQFELSLLIKFWNYTEFVLLKCLAALNAFYI